MNLKGWIMKEYKNGIIKKFKGTEMFFKDKDGYLFYINFYSFHTQII